MITMTDAEALEMQDFISRLDLRILDLAAASAGWQARAVAAEAEVAVQRDARCHYEEKWRAAEAECERLRAQLADCWTMAGLEREKAQAEVERLRAARKLLSEVYNAFGYTWPQSYVEDVGAFLANSGQDAP